MNYLRYNYDVKVPWNASKTCGETLYLAGKLELARKKYKFTGGEPPGRRGWTRESGMNVRIGSGHCARTKRTGIP